MQVCQSFEDPGIEARGGIEPPTSGALVPRSPLSYPATSVGVLLEPRTDPFGPLCHTHARYTLRGVWERRQRLRAAWSPGEVDAGATLHY